MRRRYVVIIVLLGVFLLMPALFFIGSKFFSYSYSISSLTISPTPTLDISPTLSFAKGIPVTPLTITSAFIGSHIILQYKHIYYDQNGGLNGDPVKVVVTNPDAYHWTGLVDGPDNHGNPVPLDDIFSFKVAPNGRDFLFVMQADNYIAASGSAGQAYTVYYYHSNSASPSATQLLLYKSFYTPLKKLSQQDYTVPKIDQFSSDGNYVSILLYHCAECTKHHPQYLLYNLASESQRNIGIVSNFSWLNNGAYQYKDYILTDCPPNTGINLMDQECSQDPENLPLKVGQY